ncbi:hypothetical protein RJ640_004285 [Escallonia rubra]|uniref:Methyltransferase n=1 Tax=Escallonia rubra TaxID=112253 RepID=A0AA88QT64_9ASTE|nr:hypothetical protein RJ640_004285 [Escallonia rubra]
MSAKLEPCYVPHTLPYVPVVASWGAYLLSRNTLAMSFAPKDTLVAQVQSALERGVPAQIGVLASNRLPYSSRDFDVAHCSRCLIPWACIWLFMASDRTPSLQVDSPEFLWRYGHIVTVDSELVELRQNQWQNTLIRCVWDTRKLSKTLLQRVVEHFWKLWGAIVVEQMGTWFAFHFTERSTMEAELLAFANTNRNNTTRIIVIDEDDVSSFVYVTDRGSSVESEMDLVIELDDTSFDDVIPATGITSWSVSVTQVSKEDYDEVAIRDWMHVKDSESDCDGACAENATAVEGFGCKTKLNAVSVKLGMKASELIEELLISPSSSSSISPSKRSFMDMTMDEGENRVIKQCKRASGAMVTTSQALILWVDLMQFEVKL